MAYGLSEERCGAKSRGEARIAYVMSRFPKLTETFVLYELLAVEKGGTPVEVYPLHRQRADVLHPEATRVLARAHFAPLLSWPILRAHAHFLRHRPRAYLAALGRLLWGTLGSARYFAGALALFPKTVYFARCMSLRGVTHVHAHFASHPAAAAFVIRRLVGIPFSFTAHGSDLHRDRHMLREKVAEARFVVAISRYNRDVILAHCGAAYADRVGVIHCGVDPEIFHPGDRAARAGEPLRILCVGTLHEVKGQAQLLEACRILRERGLELHCELVGEGPDRAALMRRAAALGLGARVVFHGACTRDDVAKRLREADVVAVPSVPSADGRREGIPVALLEAAASGRPIVASRLSGIPEAIDDGSEGLLVPAGDAQALADALQRLAADPALRRRLGMAARERVLKEFDLHTSARALARRFGSM